MSGFTREEVFLNRLGRESFLRFWSWPNLFRDQGTSNRKGDGKEICDLTVIFGNDILLFSDKKIKFNRTKDINVAWSRWARKAIGDSIKQIKGARRWLIKYPNRIYLDPKCKKEISINIPTKESVKFHNIVVCHGIENILAELNHEASFFIDNSIHGESHWSREGCKPFCIGQISEGNFVHIFNESTIELVLKEFDTTKDFIVYLKQRESLLSSNKLIRASSESDIIQLYYENFNEEENRHSILSDNLQKLDSIIIDKGGINTLYLNPYFTAKKDEDQISYFWDKLIECFSFHILHGSAEHKNWDVPSEIEPSLRYLAEPSRFERRILATSFIEFYYKALPGQRGTRLRFDPLNRGNAYLFLVLPFNERFRSHEQYREFRRNMLQDYCIINKYLDPQIEYIVGIACKTREKGYVMDDSFFNQGQDIVFFDFKEGCDGNDANAKLIHDKYVENGFLVKRTTSMENISEFPEETTGFRTRVDIADIKGRDRNLPCICGSGKKIKKCCGKL